MNTSKPFVRKNFIKDLFVPKDILGAFDIIEMSQKTYQALVAKDLLASQQIIITDFSSAFFEEHESTLLFDMPSKRFFLTNSKSFRYTVIRDSNVDWDELKYVEGFIIFPDYQALENIKVSELRKIELFLWKANQVFLSGKYLKLDREMNMYFSRLATTSRGNLFENTLQERNAIRAFIDFSPTQITNLIDLDVRASLMGSVRRSHYLEGAFINVSY
jgi:hypothetical protein